MSPPEFSIICRTHGGPATSVEWFLPLSDEWEFIDHESSQLILDTSYNTVYENRLLVRGSHSGKYQCRIENNIRDYFPTASYLSYCKLSCPSKCSNHRYENNCIYVFI